MDILSTLKKSLDLCVLKKDTNPRTVSLGFSLSGKKYLSGIIESKTNLLFISSEQGVLIKGVQHNDFGLNEIITLTEDVDYNPSPIIIKILIDYVRRTKNKLSYKVINKEGKKLFFTKDITSIIPFYCPPATNLESIKKRILSENKIKREKDKKPEELLGEWSQKALERNFPTHDSATKYGVAIITKENIYFGAQYSGYDQKTTIHAEMTVLLSAFMNRDYNITHIGLTSNKHEGPVVPCGCCLQFLDEMANHFNINPKIYCFSKNIIIFTKYLLSDYLNNFWKNE